jgi:hypothetical protein
LEAQEDRSWTNCSLIGGAEDRERDRQLLDYEARVLTEGYDLSCCSASEDCKNVCGRCKYLRLITADLRPSTARLLIRYA